MLIRIVAVDYSVVMVNAMDVRATVTPRVPVVPALPIVMVMIASTRLIIKCVLA